MPQRARNAAIFACFLVSGASSLTLEIVWVRLFSQVFGSSNLAIATVLAVFMGGMAIGSFLGGKLVDTSRRDPLWLYASCELGVALSALCVPWALHSFPGVNAWLWGHFGDSPMALASLRALYCTLLLLVPTTFMGATLPILAKGVIERQSLGGHIGARVARLYAVNTLGAVTGAFSAGFWLLPALGQAGLHTLAVSAAAAVALAAAMMARLSPVRFGAKSRDDEAAENPQEAPPSTDARFALLAFGISGGVAMALEALFSRAMALVLGSATQSFTLVLVLFLIGLSLGAAIFSQVAERTPRPLAWLAIALGCAAIAILLVRSYLDRLPSWHHALVRFFDVELASVGGIAVRALIAGTIAPVTFFLGMIMPLAVASYARTGDSIGRDVGRAYSINTLGAVIGSLVGGFVLLPRYGLGSGFLICASVLALAAALVASRGSGRLQIAAFVLAGVVLVGVTSLPTLGPKALNAGMFASLGQDASAWGGFQSDNKLVYQRDGLASSIAVFESHGSYALLNNGKPDGSSHEDVHTQILLGMLPAMLHPGSDNRAFVVGYGTGMTVGSLTRAPNIASVDVVELEEAVYEAADTFFSKFTHSPEKNPDVTRFVGDGRNFLMHREDQYDIVVSEPPDIWVAGVASLFSDDLYGAVKGRLAAEGIFCQWVPLYHLRASTIQMVYRTLRANFAHVHVFVLDNGNSILLASNQPIPISMAKLEERFRDKGAYLELARAGLRYPVELLALLGLSPREVEVFAGEGPIHTDNSGALEFAAQDDYLYSVRRPEHSRRLKAELDKAFAPYGDLSDLQLDLGKGQAASTRREALRSALLRKGKELQAAKWQ